MKKKFLKLVEKEGFILFLFICVCVVAGGTLFLSMRNLDTSKDSSKEESLVILESEDRNSAHFDELDPNEYIDARETFEENLESEDMGLESEEDIATLNTDEDKDEIENQYEEDGEDEYEDEYGEELEFIEEEEAGDVEPVNSIEPTVDLILPIEGPIITEFTKDYLIYSETLESWVGHKALDIGAKEGTTVLAAMDGVVEEVYEDELWGIVIVIDHGNSLKTKYSNLSTKEMVKVGVNVKKGDHISKVGKSAKVEMLMEPHIHFEVIKNEEIVDPRSINN